MEFWKCLNEELELPVEHQHTRNKVSEQEGETMFDDTSNYHFVSSQESIQFGFPDTTGKIRQDNRCDQSRYALSNQIGQECYTEVGSGCLDSAAVDLKLGGRDGESSKCVSSSVPMKRSRLTSSYSQAPVCQVYGCNKDLSSYKDYYKRHKVCDAHTKTATVIVKGIEQRFCQQCSRFHLLAEFDDGKRSCRKRLANHNERRRKAPGTRFLRSSSMRTSFLFQEMLPTAIPGPSKPEPGKWFSHIKYEDPALHSNLLLNFHDNISVETIDKNAGIPMPNNQDFSHIPDPSSALSLLSAQSLKASDPSTATLNHHHHHQHNFSSEQGLPEKAVPTTTTVSDESILFNLSSGQGTVVDLLQLSSHLQMVEHKRNLMH